VVVAPSGFVGVVILISRLALGSGALLLCCCVVVFGGSYEFGRLSELIGLQPRECEETTRVASNGESWDMTRDSIVCETQEQVAVL